MQLRLLLTLKQYITILNILYFIIFIFSNILIFEFILYNYLFNDNTLFNDINYMGLSLFITGVWVGLLIWFISDVRGFFNKFISLTFFLIFLILIYFFINETNYLMLFIYYELFLLPSFYLVYWMSPNRRSIIASIYFLTWTQTGSLCLLVVIMYLYINTNGITISLIELNSKPNWLLILFFIGIGVKVPIWPFYYWLTKTHVEASSFFSIYLSGFLVKTAIYLFYIFYPFFSTFSLDIIFLIIIAMGVIDSSIKMWHQIDVKKLIAYTTVQEMNILFLPLLWNNDTVELLVSLFIITHCLLSTLLFFSIDILIKRFHTRIVTNITGIIQTMPLFASCMIITLLLFTGLPFTIKFFIEISIFNLLLNFNLEITIILILIANWVGLLGFSKIWFNLLFGKPNINIIVYDLTIRELIIFIISFIILIFINFFFI